jgi:hypothetical protein
MNDNKPLVLIFFFAIIISCSKEDNPIEISDNQKIEYYFENIEFLISDQSEESEYYVNMPTIVYSNGTNLAQTFPHNLLEGIFETSQFQGVDSSVINHIINSPLISIPIDIDTIVYLGEAKWPISNNFEQQELGFIVQYDYLIETDTKMTINSKIYWRMISTDFILTLTDSKENREHVFEGRWSGEYPIGYDLEVIFEEL